MFFAFLFLETKTFSGRRSDLSKLNAYIVVFAFVHFFGKKTSVADAETNSCKIVRQLVELSRLVGMPSDGQHRWFSSKDSLLNNAITKHKWENMNPSHKDSQLMRNSDTASDQWSMSGLTTHCPSQARAKTDNSDGKMTQKLSQTVQIKTDSKIVLMFPRSLLPHNYHATQLPARCSSTKRRTGSRKQFQARGFSAWWQIKILVVSGNPSCNLSG